MVQYISPLYSILNYLANLLQALVGIKLTRVTYDVVVSKLSANAREDLSKDAGLRERLRVACLMVDQDASITFYGRTVLLGRLSDALEVRAGVKRLIAKQPKILETPIVKPVVLVNLPRTGSTIVQRILESDKRFMLPLVWEMEHTHDLHNPENQHISNFEKYFFPQRLFKHIHIMGPQLTDESTGMMNRDFLSSDLPALLNEQFTLFATELSDDQMAELYANMKQNLQVILDYRGDIKGKRLLIKIHSNMLNVPALLRVFPDAVIVMGHRDPLECIPSLCSLAWIFISQFTTGWKKPFMGLKMNWWIYSAARQQIKERNALSEEKRQALFVDFSYKSLLRDTMNTMKELYQRMGVDWTKGVENEVTSFLENNKQGKHGAHHYTLEEYGLTPAYLKHTWSEYYDYFKKYL